MEKNIEHEGIVKNVDHKSVFVILSPMTSCSGCFSAVSCGMSENTEKIVKIPYRPDVTAGDRVVVVMKQSMGYSALLLGYVLPLIIVVFLLVILISLSINELYSGLISIGSLLPYYFALFIYRNYIDRKFSFTLKT